MEKFCLSVIVSKENPWILKPWHVRAAFRRKRIIVPEDAIELPPREIKGPDMSIQDKEFYVTITVHLVIICLLKIVLAFVVFRLIILKK